MTQSDRVLAALTRAGARGITRVDFQPPNVIDGGKPILNIPGRIYDLHKAGIGTVVVGERDGCSVYVLERVVQEASEPVPGRDRVVETAPPAAPTETLFDTYVDRDTSHWKAA